jgi:hypothetical protein
VSESTEYVMANALPGLLTGWRGPVSMDWHIDGEAPFVAEGVVLSTHTALDGERVVWYCDDRRIGRDNRSPVFLRLDLRRPEVRSQIARVLASPVCPRCGGTSKVETIYGCPDCSETGKRTPTPIWHLLPTTEGGTLAAEYAAHSAALIACSVARVAVGLGVVRGVLGAWAEWQGSTERRGRVIRVWRGGLKRKSATSNGSAHVAWNRWYLTDDACQTEERDHAAHPTENVWEAYACARIDAAALAAGFALLGANGIALPRPKAA